MMYRRLDLPNRPEDDPTMMSRWGPLSNVTRATRFGHSFYSPQETAEASQPFFGFPGGREGWIRWRQTGQLPDAIGGLDARNIGRQLSPEQRAVYRMRPGTQPTPGAVAAGRVVTPRPQPTPSSMIRPGFPVRRPVASTWGRPAPMAGTPGLNRGGRVR